MICLLFHNHLYFSTEYNLESKINRLLTNEKYKEEMSNEEFVWAIEKVGSSNGKNRYVIKPNGSKWKKNDVYLLQLKASPEKIVTSLRSIIKRLVIRSNAKIEGPNRLSLLSSFPIDLPAAVTENEVNNALAVQVINGEKIKLNKLTIRSSD